MHCKYGVKSYSFDFFSVQNVLFAINATSMGKKMQNYVISANSCSCHCQVISHYFRIWEIYFTISEIISVCTGNHNTSIPKRVYVHFHFECKNVTREGTFTDLNLRKYFIL